MKSEIQQHAAFTHIRYANCWEDADILIEALSPENRHCLSIGSAGDNSFSLIAAGAKKVTIAELNPSQVACIELRKAAYSQLEHHDFLVLLGERGTSSEERQRLYQKCRKHLPEEAQAYWDHYTESISRGFGTVGKFESYFDTFRTKVLPLVHSRKTISELLLPKTQQEHKVFYQTKWNTWRWRLLFRLFFSRTVMGRLGRDPSFFRYVEGSVADRIFARAEHALTNLSPATNPYLHWILEGSYGDTLPHALREENYDSIKNSLDKLEIQTQPIEAILENSEALYDAYNLSDIFEYMSEENTELLLRKIHRHSSQGARLAYWNMLAPRSAPESLGELYKSHHHLSSSLFYQDKAFFYSKFIVEETL